MLFSPQEPKRFWSKVAVGEADECWEWLAGKTGAGYGAFAVRHDCLWGAHRAVWVLTFGPIQKGLLVCHHCDNPSCCNPYHLFLGTHADNVADSVKKGRLPLHKGEANNNSKLTEDEVLDIRELRATGEWTLDELAEEFGVSYQHISRISRRKRWTHLKEVS